MEGMKDTAPAGPVGCTIDGRQEGETEILNKVARAVMAAEGVRKIEGNCRR
jgi:hypothetical protein